MSAEKGGALRTEYNAGRRATLALGFGATLVAVPLMLLSGPANADHAGGGSLSAPSARPGAPGPVALVRDLLPRAALVEAVAVTTTTTSPAPPTAPAPAAQPPATPPPTAAPPTTTPPTTAPPPPPVVAATSAARGIATWYATSPRPTGCASPTLPFGTVLNVVNDADGVAVTCVVDDREPYHPGRIVDLAYTTFVQLASPAQGIVTVTITW